MTVILGGLALGAVYALVAIGYNIIFISSKTFNFAQAQLMMFGAFIVYTGVSVFGLNPVIAAVLAMIIVAGIAYLEFVLAIRPVKDQHNVLVTTLGAAVLLDGSAQLLWGGEPLKVPFFAGDSAIDIFGGRVYPVEIALVLVVAVLVIGFAVYGRVSLTGLALRGMSEDSEAAQLRGVNVRNLALMTFIFAGALAGLLGVIVGPKTFAVATLGTALALKGFVVLAIGGFGSMPGAAVGGVIVGLTEALAARYLGGEFAVLAVFILLIVILLLRPSGLFVRTKERTV
ncbi:MULTISPECIES: branched-chain amino acid ABC transporter permease [Arthrobacter]|uniref:Branched-chain amino acid ABC transporter permease n=1 Tax=Arthrobacter sunyaminii TaxID=2816859 RepID=A0A975PC90_9MICC|nr:MULTISPECIES: branched-chain amino acid ABC transporter permease [Arthrobacter]MBO0907057.1 branched-chain amino acid ABC transporter permease [Arthrobacter sunyaminii]QWQ34688.1 branched-chain amino acid ABC transporter permease [Arthrobacter sunyaminii]